MYDIEGQRIQIDFEWVDNRQSCLPVVFVLVIQWGLI